MATFIKFLSLGDTLRSALEHVIPSTSLPSDEVQDKHQPASHDPTTPPSSLPEPVRAFFASVSSPTEILSSQQVSRVEGTEVIEGGYNFVHVLNLDIGESQPPFPFVLRFPIDPDSISRSQTRTSVGCMLYCQRRPDLNIPTPAVYAYNCTYGSEFIAMEYLDGEALSDIWLEIPEEEKQDMINRIAEVMRTMRTKTCFEMIGGISPDGSLCPLVDDMDVGPGKAQVESFGLYNIGPYESMREFIQAVFDRRYHYLDQMLHRGTLSAYEAEFKEEMSKLLTLSTAEEVFERVKYVRNRFMANPYDPQFPFVLRHGDLHGRNVIVSRSSPRRILGIIDWDFGGSHALPFADADFELSYPDSDKGTHERIKQAEEVYRSQLLLGDLVGSPCPKDYELSQLLLTTRLFNLNITAQRASGKAALY